MPLMKKRASHLRLTLVQKLITGYAAMTLFTMAALISSILGLYSLNKTAREIVNTDLIFIDTISKLRDSIVAQERYASKYAILKSPEFISLFQRRQSEFQDMLASAAKPHHVQEIAAFSAVYDRFRVAVADLFNNKTTSIKQIQATSTNVVNALDMLYSREQLLLDAKLKSADRKESSTVNLTLFLSFTGFLLAVGVAIVTIVNISRAIGKLKQATHRIAAGDFDYDPQIPAGDEIGALAEDFTRMAARLKISEQMCLDASPLTRLPGNIAIERVLSKRLQEGKPFAVCYADLDNFKAYNDHYGYIKASEVIKITGEIIYEVVDQLADEEAFVGHVGGDDFVMVVSCETADAVCQGVIDRFGSEIVKHYSPEDLAAGAIDGVDRYGVPRTFPIMTISIAVVIGDATEYDSAVEIAKTAAQIKDHAKGLSGSNYFVNRRRTLR
jgi:GGDEF domain-containing protein